MSALQETHKGLFKIKVNGEGGLADSDVEGDLLLVRDQCHQIQRQIGVDYKQDYGIILLHHPLDIVDMVVDNFTDELSCLRVILPLTGTEHVVGLLIVIIGRSPATYLKTGIEVHQLKDIVVVFIITINMFVSGITSCCLDEIAGQSKRVIFIIHLIHIKD